MSDITPPSTNVVVMKVDSKGINEDEAREVIKRLAQTFGFTVTIQDEGGSWEDDSVQFPRLLAEIVATQENLDVPALAAAMDLEEDDVIELLDRAQERWDAVVADT